MAAVVIGQRITNGQRAAICGLILAGLSFRQACKVTATPHARMRKLLDKSWTYGARPGLRKWKGQLLEDVKEAYFDPAIRMRTIREVFGIHPANLCKLAQEHDWPPRSQLKQRRFRSAPPQQLARTIGRDAI